MQGPKILNCSTFLYWNIGGSGFHNLAQKNTVVAIIQSFRGPPKKRSCYWIPSLQISSKYLVNRCFGHPKGLLRRCLRVRTPAEDTWLSRRTWICSRTRIALAICGDCHGEDSAACLRASNKTRGWIGVWNTVEQGNPMVEKSRYCPIFATR